jgi:hypothetical protein
VNAVVEAPGEAVGQALDVELLGRQSGAEAGEDGAADVGDAVALRVLQVNDVGRGDDEDAAVVAADSSRPGKSVGIDGGFVVDAVVVGVLQDAHAAHAVVAAVGVVAHLDDEQAAALVEGDGDGAGDQRLGGGEFEFEAFLDFEGVDGLVGRGGGDAGEIVGSDGWLGSANAETCLAREDAEQEREEGYARLGCLHRVAPGHSCFSTTSRRRRCRCGNFDVFASGA